MGKTIKSKLKCVPPRLADIKDINVNMSGEVDVEIGWGARTRLATDAGYSTGSWDANDCGSNNTDFDDLYEKAVVTFAVNLNRTAKAKPQLKKLGVK